MKYIDKNTAPASLEEYRAIEGACYDDMPREIKDEVRKSLVSEQGGICCYCGRRITPDFRSVIEHLLPKNKYKDLQLVYSNLLCSCDGGRSEREGKTKSEKKQYPSFCDSKKNNRILKLTPLDPTCEEQFICDEEGNIYAKTEIAQEAIDILGLDCGPLNHMRQAAIEPYLELELDEAGWNKEIDRLSQRHDDNFLPFCFAVIFYIKNFKISG